MSPDGTRPAPPPPSPDRPQSSTKFGTYSTYDRGVEQLMGTYRMLDLAPLGRSEEGLEFGAAWWHRHDEYEEAAPGATT